jgi:NitT/TauT family transport system substrate-binding protein
MKSTTKFVLGAAFGGLALSMVSTTPASALTDLNVITANNGSCSIYAQHVGRLTGAYETNGVEVNLLNSETTIPYVAFLDTGDAEYVMLDSAQVLQMANAGQPGSVVYEAYNFASEGIVVPADSPIKGLNDLPGSVIGLASDRDEITTLIALDSVGLPGDSIETVVVGDAGPVMVDALTSGRIDGFAGGSSDRANIQAGGVAIRNITPMAVSANPGNSFAMWDSRMDELDEATAGFLRGWAMAQHMGVLDTKFVISVCAVATPEVFENMQTGSNLINGSVYIYQLRRTNKYGEPRNWIWAQIQRSEANGWNRKVSAWDSTRRLGRGVGYADPSDRSPRLRSPPGALPARRAPRPAGRRSQAPREGSSASPRRPRSVTDRGRRRPSARPWTLPRPLSARAVGALGAFDWGGLFSVHSDRAPSALAVPSRRSESARMSSKC